MQGLRVGGGFVAEQKRDQRILLGVLVLMGGRGLVVEGVIHLDRIIMLADYRGKDIRGEKGRRGEERKKRQIVRRGWMRKGLRCSGRDYVMME